MVDLDEDEDWSFSDDIEDTDMERYLHFVCVLFQTNPTFYHKSWSLPKGILLMETF